MKLLDFGNGTLAICNAGSLAVLLTNPLNDDDDLQAVYEQRMKDVVGSYNSTNGGNMQYYLMLLDQDGNTYIVFVDEYIYQSVDDDEIFWDEYEYTLVGMSYNIV